MLNWNRLSRLDTGERKGKAGRHTLKVERQQPQMQFEIDFFLILFGTWPRSLFRQQEEQSEHTYIREVMQVFLTCTHTTGWAKITLTYKLSQQTFSPPAFSTPNHPTEVYKLERQTTNQNANKTCYSLTLRANISARITLRSGLWQRTKSTLTPRKDHLDFLVLAKLRLVFIL